jgi:hypothetical protein
MVNVARTSEIEFMSTMAPALANRRRLREAIDVVVDGKSLSEALDLAPLDRVTVQSMPQSQWFNDGPLIPVLCPCGDAGCVDVATSVRRDGPLVSWTLPGGRTVVFEVEAATRSLRRALSD